MYRSIEGLLENSFFTEITEWNLDKNTLSKTVSFKHPRTCLKIHNIYNKKLFWGRFDQHFIPWGRFDQFLGTFWLGDVLTWGRFDCNPANMEETDRERLPWVEAHHSWPSRKEHLEIRCGICYACSQPVTWKGAQWCGWCPCTCMLIKNPIMIYMMMYLITFLKSL